ncbi:MAG: ThiF family adenylyltransferase [Candidatus Thorarchaeota archaeon]
MSQRSNFTSELLSDEEKRRFDRQFRLPGWNQELLKQSTVLLAGIGGLGVEIAKNLAMVGVGRLILVDLDTIEYSNLNRQVLFVGAPEGSSKAEYGAKQLRRLNPFIQVEGYHTALQDLAPQFYYEADLFIAGLDSIEARSELNRRAIHFRKPLIDAGTAAYNGHIYVVWPFHNACLECDPLTEREQDQLGACTLVGVPRRPAHCILKGQLKFEQDHGRNADILHINEIKEVQAYANSLLLEHFPGVNPFTVDQIIQIIDNHEPTVITINTVVASIQSQEAIKILHHLLTPSDGQKLGTLQLNYIIYNGLTGKFYEIPKPRNQECELCGPRRSPLYRVRAKPSHSVGKVIEFIANKKQIPFDSEFPPTVFRIDSSEVDEVSLDLSLEDLNIRNHESVLVTGFENVPEIYLNLQYK